MNIYPNSEVPISEADRSEIESLFIALMRARDGAAHAGDPAPGNENLGKQNLVLPFFDPPGNLEDLRSQWGL
jgi:hypothetical protein